MENNKFEFNYSAPTEKERKEIERIRRQYESKTLTDRELKMARLRKLDSKVRNLSMILPLTFGIVGTLIFGLGLTLILEWSQWILGIIFALIGVIPILIAYPSYKFIIKRAKKLYGEEILKLTEELLNESDTPIND